MWEDNASQTHETAGIKTDFQFFANKGLAKQSIKELERSVSSWKQNIDIHRDKLNHPENYDANWYAKSDKHKAGLLKHWEKEIRNFEKNMKEAATLIEERSKIDE